MTQNKRYSESFLEGLRQSPLPETLTRMNIPWRADESFKPRKRQTEKCLLAFVDGEERRIVYDGIKWLDQTKNISGGGAIDVLMKLLNYEFVDAVRELKSKQAG